MSFNKYITFVIFPFFLMGGLMSHTGIPPAYGAGLSATDTIAPEKDAQLPFGEVAVGKISFPEIVAVHNENNFLITISGIQIAGPHASSFSVNLNDGDAPCGGGPRQLPANSICTLSLLFRPGTSGIQSAFLNISLVNNIEEKIAFQDIETNGISLYDVATGDVTELTNPGVDQEDRNPAWSPAGRQIVFNRHSLLVNGSDDIILKNIEGPEEPLLLGRGSTPAWSPDGRRLAFHDQRWGGVSLWNFSLDLDNLGSSASGESFNPSWSPNGRELVFRRIDPFVFSSNIVRLTIDEVNPSNSEEKNIIFNARTPAWSPDGGRIAYHDNKSNGIFLHRIDTTISNQQLTFPPTGSRDLHPSWSPDSDQIVFHRSSSDGLLIVSVSGGTSKILSPKGRNPAWSPLLPNLALTLSGTGLSDTTNSPPSAPQLISPDIDAADVPTDVIFRWLDSIDPDGDPVSHDLRVCEDTNFSIGCKTGSNFTKLDKKTITFAGLGTVGGSSLLFFGAGIVFLKRRSQSAGVLLLCSFITAGLLVGCGGGGGSGRISAGEKKEIAQEITELKGNTVYFWKVIASDDHGNKTTSQIRQFTTG